MLKINILFKFPLKKQINNDKNFNYSMKFPTNAKKNPLKTLEKSNKKTCCEVLINFHEQTSQ